MDWNYIVYLVGAIALAIVIVGIGLMLYPWFNNLLGSLL